MVPFWEERGLRLALLNGVCVRSVGNDKGREGRSKEEGTSDTGVAISGWEVEGCCKGVEPEEPTIGAVVSR